MLWLWEFVTEPTNAVILLLGVVVLILFRDLRYTVWQAVKLAGAACVLVYAVKVLAT